MIFKTLSQEEQEQEQQQQQQRGRPSDLLFAGKKLFKLLQNGKKALPMSN